MAIVRWTSGHLSPPMFYHRLNGSSSPVLTATCLSYGSLCDFLTFFSSTYLEVTPLDRFWCKMAQTTGSRTHVPFGVKIATFENPRPSDAQNCQNLPNFGQELENFRSISRLTLGVSRVNTPYSSSEPVKSVIVNRQCGGGKFKYVPKFCKGVQVTWHRACAMTICTGQALWRPISRKLLEIEAWSQWKANRNWVRGVEWSHDHWRHVILQVRNNYAGLPFCPIKGMVNIA